MTLHEDVYSVLSGGSPAARVYADALPERVILPALTFVIAAGNDDVHLQGRSGLVERLVQVDAWAGTRLSAEAAINDARDKMMASRLFQVSAIDITGVDLYEPDTERYRASREFTVWAQE